MLVIYFRKILRQGENYLGEIRRGLIMGYIILQLVLFIPFYLIWRNDCKEIGKNNLAVSLGERFMAWLVVMPIWIIPFIK